MNTKNSTSSRIIIQRMQGKLNEQKYNYHIFINLILAL